MNATFESQLTARGVRTRRIRKLSTVIATATQLVFSALFVAAPSARIATVFHCLMTFGGTFHYSGLEANYVEVGGANPNVLRFIAFPLLHIPL
eukprot:SAG11_NODE_1222_length_5484_cov_7.843268_5_plen_93_part_00